MPPPPRIVPIKQLATHEYAEVSLALLAGASGASPTPCVLHHLLAPQGIDTLPPALRTPAQAVIALEHGNLIRTLSVEVVEGRPAVLTEYVRGASLGEVLSACRGMGLEFTAAMTVFVARETARGLAHAHARLGPHGALAPEALLISVEGEVKITDFSFALAVAGGGEPWKTAGRRRYAAPELLAGGVPTASSDVFSLAMLVKDALDWGSKHEMLPAELREIIGRCSATQPDQRLGVAAELDRALTIYLAGHHPDFIPRKMGTFVETMLGGTIEKRAGLIRDGVTRGATNIGTGLNNTGQFAPGPGEASRSGAFAMEDAARSPRPDGYRPDLSTRSEPPNSPLYRPAVIGGRQASGGSGHSRGSDATTFLKWGAILISIAIIAYAVIDHLRK